MANLNRVFLIGNLTRDPEVKYASSGNPVCKMGLAMNRKFKTAAGEPKEEVCFVDVDVWGRQAEACGEYLSKGSSIFVEGFLRLEQWESSTKEKRSRLSVRADRVQFLDRLRRPADQDDAGEKPATDSARPAPAAPAEGPASDNKGEKDEDDIPF
ncbi:MAG: single-stranded DNA-binding protein [Lentisphaerae bacterium]|nr:single-stranded DNA-binding protein [Lentisphaerota bacterium]